MKTTVVLLSLFTGSALAQSTAAPAQSSVDRAVEAERANPTLNSGEVQARLRAELNTLLTDMAKHIVAVDVDAYLAHIDPRDVPFVNEQKYFAKDLFKKPAAEITYTLGEELRMPEKLHLPGGPSVVEADLTIEWSMLKPDGTAGKARKVSFDARFSKVGGAWKYSGEAWERYEAEGVIVLFWPGSEELAKGVAEVFPEIKHKVEEGFNLTVPHAQEIKLFNSMRHLQHSICLSYTDGLGGWNEPGEPIKQLAHKGQTGESSKVVLAHEFGHACTFELGPTSNSMPWWILEGVAELSAEQFSKSAERNDRDVRSMSQAGKIPEWKALADFGDVSKENYGKVYTLGHHMLGYISERFGRKGRIAWLKALSTGSNLDQATRSALGISFDQLDTDWRAEIAKPGAPEPAQGNQ